MFHFIAETVTQYVITDCVINFQSFNQGRSEWYTADSRTRCKRAVGMYIYYLPVDEKKKRTKNAKKKKTNSGRRWEVG